MAGETAPKAEQPVRVGQVWEDRDGRCQGRVLRVVDLTEKRDPWGRYWPAATLRGGTDGAGRAVVIQVRNLRKRFRLVNAPKESM